MDIEELTALEDEWLARMRRRGSSDQKDKHYRQSGVYEAWNGIFEQYVALARERGDVEAMKRAIFLVWYRVADPEWITGIMNLDRQAVREIFRIANEAAGSGQLDTELTWMLPYYYSVADWYLPLEFDGLKKASVRNTRLWMTGCIESSFTNRGQLGQYWESIQANLQRT